MWESVDQTMRKAAKPAPPPVRLALIRRKSGTSSLSITVNAATAAALGWTVGLRLGLEIGREGKVAGWIRVSPQEGGRHLRALPRSANSLNVLLLAPEDMWRWTGESMEALDYKVGGRGVLLAELPWDLSGDPEAAQGEAEREAA